MTDPVKLFKYIISAIDVCAIILYIGVFAHIMIKYAECSDNIDNVYTKRGLLISYGFIIFNAILSNYVLPSSNVLINLLSSGLIMSMITCDLIINKMAKKQLSQWIVTLTIASSLNSFIGIVLSIIFIIGNLLEIAEFMRINIFLPNINVYCSGVFDMCHYGHTIMFENASKNGNRLIVGVHNDADVQSYKRTPTMTHDERCNAVSHCKYVDQIVKNASLHITKELIAEYNIHVVVCSDEYYNDPTDEFYKVAKDMGILVMIPYSKSISTSDLMKRIIARHNQMTQKND
jgi:cytidyltransferase-like protein